MHLAGTHCREYGFIPSFHWHLLSTYNEPDSAGSWQLEGYCGWRDGERQRAAGHIMPLCKLERGNPSKASVV